MVSDTHPDIERLQIELMRQLPAWRKVELIFELNRTARLFAMAGLRQRHPDATEDELNRRLADIILGPELAEKAYGPLNASPEASSGD